MKFVCDRCQTKYSIADDKVRGKVLKVRCKTCQNVITVREPGARPSVGSLAPVRPAQKPSTGPIPTLGETHDELSERTAIAAVPAAFMAELAQQQPRRATPPPPPPLGDGIEWFLALEGAQQGPFTRKVLPSASGEPAKRSCQSPYEITATGSRPGCDASSGRRNRPSAGRTRNASK